MSEVVVLSREQLTEIVHSAINDALMRAPSNTEEILTADGVGELLKIHPKVVAQYVHEKGLPGFKLGPNWRFRRSAVLQWLDKQVA